MSNTHTPNYDLEDLHRLFSSDVRLSLKRFFAAVDDTDNPILTALNVTKTPATIGTMTKSRKPFYDAHPEEKQLALEAMKAAKIRKSHERLQQHLREDSPEDSNALKDILREEKTEEKHKMDEAIRGALEIAREETIKNIPLLVAALTKDDATTESAIVVLAAICGKFTEDEDA